MTDLPPYRDTGDGLEHESSTGTPLWVKVLAWGIPIILVIVFIGLHLTGVVGPGTGQ